MKKVSMGILFVIVAFNAFSQENIEPDTLRKDALKVHMDADDYVRQNLPFINYVRDLKDAQVYIMSSSQSTGSGGEEFCYFLVGQHEFAGMKDTLKFVTSPDDTQDDFRKLQVKTLKQGLMRYVRQTPLSKYIEISFTQPVNEEVSSDNWDSWVFRTSINGFLNGQKTYSSNRIFGSVSANRITSDWKFDLNVDYSYNLDRFEIEGETLNSINQSKSAKALVVKSLGDHWSAGGKFRVRNSSFSNYRLKIEAMPGIEYDIYPYAESTTRQLRLLYTGGYIYQAYMDTTIYDKLEENLWGHSLSAAYQVVQKWGSVNFNLTWFNYLHDFSKNNLSLSGELDIRIAKGLNLNFGGGASLVHDQLALVKGGASPEEILLRRKELASQYQYFTYFGLSYTFGSIYNNVVNPRFGGSSGGMQIIIH